VTQKIGRTKQKDNTYSFLKKKQKLMIPLEVLKMNLILASVVKPEK